MLGQPVWLTLIIEGAREASTRIVIPERLIADVGASAAEPGPIFAPSVQD